MSAREEPRSLTWRVEIFGGQVLPARWKVRMWPRVGNPKARPCVLSLAGTGKHHPPQVKLIPRTVGRGRRFFVFTRAVIHLVCIILQTPARYGQHSWLAALGECIYSRDQTCLSSLDDVAGARLGDAENSNPPQARQQARNPRYHFFFFSYSISKQPRSRYRNRTLT